MTIETYAETFSYGSIAGRFASIDYADSMGGYEWDQFHVLRGVDGLLYVGFAGGCSCYGFSDEDPADFKRVESWQDAATEAQAWAKSEDWNEERRTEVVMNLIERLAQSRPAASIAIDPRNPFGDRA